MKTLKKSLCLILALVFVLGLCTFGAGAAFTDDADINYDGAVTVMSGLGILKGYEDGSFQPAKTVTRAEAATMITKMILGEEAAAKLPAASAFADVPADNWAAPYVNYCATKGIIKGYGDGNYGPNDPVTGLQLAKMLLVACGYGEMNEFAPDTWEIYTFTYAIETGIYDDVDTSDFSAPATREECALYVFNTLIKVLQVKYDVDVNDYASKGYTYGTKTYKLNDKVGIVVANQATGEDYTQIKLARYDSYGKVLRNADDEIVYDTVATNFNIKSGAELIGHQVEVYYNFTEKKDADKVAYFNTYLADDISTVYALSNIFAPKTLGTLAKEMGYPKGYFDEIPVWENGIFEDNYMDDIMSVPSGFDPAALTYFSVYTLASDTVVSDLTNTGAVTTVAKANGSKDTDSSYLPFDSLIVDEDGALIGAIKDSYDIGTVIDLDDEVAVVELEDGTLCEAKIENCYEGIAVDDYATVTWCGDIFTLLPTSTTTAVINDIYYGSFFNGMSIMSTKWRNIVVDTENEAADSTSDIEVGDTVKFFIDAKFNAFDAVIVDTATVSYVLVTKVYDTVSTSYGDDIHYLKVQGVDAGGNEVNLTVGTGSAKDNYTTFSTAENAVTEPEAGTLYRTSAAANGLTTLREGTAYGCNTISGTYDSSATRISGTRQYLTDATTYLYIDDNGEKLTVKKGSFLKKAANVEAFYAGDANTSGVVSTVWVLSEAPASASSSYIYILGTYGLGMKEGTMLVDGDPYNYLTVYIDGVKTANVPVAEECWIDDDTWGLYIPAGMYKYSVKDGVYTLEAATMGTEYEYIMITGEDAVYNGKLLVQHSAMDDIALADYNVVDLSNGYKDSKGFSHAITSAASLSAALKADYMVMMYYALDEVDDVLVPTGTIYVTYCAPVA